MDGRLRRKGPGITWGILSQSPPTEIMWFWEDDTTRVQDTTLANFECSSMAERIGTNLAKILTAKRQKINSGTQLICRRQAVSRLVLLLVLFSLGAAPAWAQSAGWTQVGATFVEEAWNDQLGNAVALSSDGSRVAMGARYNDGGATNAGYVRVYEYSGGSLTQLGPDFDGESDGYQSGYAVALSSDGSRVAMGAPNHDGNGAYGTGQGKVYDWTGSTWSQVGTDIFGEEDGEFAGISLDLSANGNRLALGTNEVPKSGGRAGQVRIYDWNGTAWNNVGADIDDEAHNDWHGYSGLALSSNGNRVAIGAYRNDGNGVDAGHVRVHEWTGTSWTQMGTDIDGEAADDSFGSSVALSSEGTVSAVGGTISQVRVFSWNDTNWSQIDTAIGSGGGSFVILSSDGSRVGFKAGKQGRVYEGDGTTWAQVGLDIGPQTEISGPQSAAISTEGSRVVLAWRLARRHRTLWIFCRRIRLSDHSDSHGAAMGHDSPDLVLACHRDLAAVGRAGDGHRGLGHGHGVRWALAHVDAGGPSHGHHWPRVLRLAGRPTCGARRERRLFSRGPFRRDY